MMTNLSKKQRKQSPLAAVALLSVLLGAQVAVFADVDPTGPGGSYAFNFGFNIGYDEAKANMTASFISLDLAGHCHNAFGSGAGNTSFNQCVNGGKVGVKTYVDNS